MDEGVGIVPEKEGEVEFLRYFYSAAGDCFGPADFEIYAAIKRNYKKKSGKALPEEYSDPDEEE